jgi:hypothetical protein
MEAHRRLSSNCEVTVELAVVVAEVAVFDAVVLADDVTVVLAEPDTVVD